MVPTVGTVSRQLQGAASALQGIASHVHGLRNDIDNLTERQKTISEDVAVLRKRLCDEPTLAAASVALTRAAEPVAGQARPSLAVQAAKATSGFGKYGLMALGALGLAAQIAAVYRPGLVGPLQTLIQMLQMLGGQK
jgi:hypothetical protein